MVIKNRVVVGLDETPAAQAAMRWAAQEAYWYGAELMIVHADAAAAGRRTFYTPTGWAASPDGYDDDAVLEHADTFLRAAYPSLPVALRRERRRPEPALLDHAEDADLLVLGSGASDNRLGPVVMTCLRRAQCPVVIVNGSRAPAGTAARTASAAIA